MWKNILLLGLGMMACMKMRACMCGCKTMNFDSSENTVKVKHKEL